MKIFLLCLYELARFISAMLAVALWFFLGMMCLPAPGATMAVSTRDCGPAAHRVCSPGFFLSTARRERTRIRGDSARPMPRAGRLARVTVYSPDEPGGDYWTRRRRSATGIRLRPGHCAVDPRRIPYGSIVIVGGRRLLAVDCGAFRGWHVDVFFDRWRDARRWDQANADFLPITVIQPNKKG